MTSFLYIHLFTINYIPAIVFAETQFYNISKNRWEQEYSKGLWQYLNDIAIERARSVVIALFATMYGNSHINTYLHNSTILDVGCGEGVLSDFLNQNQKQKYHGLDISDKAIDIARTKRKLRFDALAVEDFKLSAFEQLGTIIFNEMLYYVEHYSVLTKFQQILPKEGIVIISVWFSYEDKKSIYRRNKIFEDANKIFNQVDEIVIEGKTLVFSSKNAKRPVGARIGVFKQRD